MKTKNTLAYCPHNADEYGMGTILDLSNGTAVWNLMWLALDFEEGVSFAPPHNVKIPQAAWRTVHCRADTCVFVNPFSPTGGHPELVADKLYQPPLAFVDWAESLPAGHLDRLPITQLLGSGWLATAKRRIDTCAATFAAPSLDTVQGLLAKFRL